MDRLHDLGAVDALQVDAGNSEAPRDELALDHQSRQAFVRHLQPREHVAVDEARSDVLRSVL